MSVPARVWRITTAGGDGAVNFLDADGGIMFHFNPRPTREGKIVMNNKPAGGGWKREERLSMPASTLRGPFTATVAVDDAGYAVSFEGSEGVAHVFQHRVAWTTFANLSGASRGWIVEERVGDEEKNAEDEADEAVGEGFHVCVALFKAASPEEVG